jgi:hypothetical protein
MDLLTLLKLDLSVRPDNNLWGSGLGGNPSELFYLLNKNTYFSLDDGDDVIFHESDDDFSIVCGRDVRLIPLRKKLTKYFGYLEEVSFGELVNAIKFGNNINTNSQDILNLRDCMMLSDKLYDCLYSKEGKRIYIKNEYLVKDRDLLDRFGKYIKYNDDMFNRLEGGLSKRIDRDPIWGVQRIKLQQMAREEIINLLIEEEIELMKEINRFPPHITFLCARLVIGNEWLINYPLDKYINNFIIAAEGFKVK